MTTKKPTKQTKPARAKLASSNRSRRLLPFIAIFAVMGTYLLFFANASPDRKPIERFVDQPERGVVWAGLKANPNSALCGGNLLEIIDQTGNANGCTHGPDPAPAGVDVNVPAAALATGEDSLTVASAIGVPCDGDGVSGNRVEAIYARASDVADRYDQYAYSFQAWAAATNNVVVESAQQTGGVRNIRFVTNHDCSVAVRRVTLSPSGDDTMGNTISELGAQGYNKSDRKYLVWMDAGMFCGMSNIRSDDSPGSTNQNNRGPSVSRIDNFCWGRAQSVEAHELMHALGGVQLSAPHATAGYHCTDAEDLMCYADGSDVTMTYVCPAAQGKLFDCNHDDYFHTNPLSGNYLATHWNTANNSFLISGNGGTTPPPPSGDTTLPVVTITAPANGTIVKRQTPVSATATDNVGVVKMEVYIDGALKATSTSGSISTNWNASKASRGSHTITVKAYDAAGNVGQSSVTVTK